MMYKFRLLIVFVALSLLVIIVSCKKDTPSEPADKFVGIYSYTLNAFSLGVQIGDFDIKKTAPDKIRIMTMDSAITYYSVIDSIITEDAGQYNNLPISKNGDLASFTETSTGKISNRTITINGSWSNPAYTSVNFQIVAQKK